MSDPKTAAKTTTAAPKPAPEAEDAIVLPKPALNTAPASVAKTASATPAAGLSSVGAELHPDAEVSKVAGMATLNAGGPYVSAAPAPTPAEAVAYPSTGGLPDTGPNSKYVLGTYTGPELYNRDGDRVNADGKLIDEFGNVLNPDFSSVDLSRDRSLDTNLMRQPEVLSEATKAEMQAGKAALRNR